MRTANAQSHQLDHILHSHDVIQPLLEFCVALGCDTVHDNWPMALWGCQDEHQRLVAALTRIN
jgi:hypothetical protein